MNIPPQLALEHGLRLRRKRSAALLLATAVVGATALATAAPSAVAHVANHSQRSGAPGAVVLDWNRISLRTFTERAVPVPVQALYAGFGGTAVSNAVLTIEGGYRPYLPQDPAAPGASVEAAASTAAYQVLTALLPASEAALAADRDRWLAQVTDPSARATGVEVGADAAGALLAAREGDGRGAAITLVTIPGPGVWDPPPTGMLAPWLGFVRPMAVPSPTWLPLSGPDPLTSRRYAKDFAEVKAMGVKTGSARTPAQTENALFYNFNSVNQYNSGLTDRLERHGADARESARSLALLNIATADAVIACWRAKYDVHNWRPQQAIQRADTDGNGWTAPDPAWEPLVPNPPYGDYASGHACISGAFSETLANLYGRNAIDVTLFSGVTGTTKQYDRASVLNRDTKNARIWLGLHFRHAMVAGNWIGRESADYTFAHQLQRVG
jgi:hypothetical protein